MRLGRYPAHAAVKHYVSKMKGRWRGRTTIPEETRKLYWIANTLEDMKKEGLIKSTDPRRISEDDVQHFLLRIASLDPDSQRRHISRFNSFLKFFKNFTIETMIAQGYVLPRCAHKNIRVIETEDLTELFHAANELTGWHGSINRGMMAFYFATGARPSELREAEFKDLDMRKERIFIRMPKGVGSWAAPEWRDIIRGDMIPLIRQYLTERESHLIECGMKEAKYLFPNTYRGADSFFSANCWRDIKQELVEATGIDFKIKDFRSTLTSITVNDDLSRLPAMSIQLGHANIGTTQKFYANINRSNAGKQLKNLWKESGSLVSKHPSIESEKEVTGYV